MKKIYIAVISFFVLCIFLIIAAFVYLDKEKRKTFYYIVNLEGRDIGAIRVDRFITEEKVIYKSAADTPMNAVFTETRSRLVLDREFRLIDYSRIHLGDRTSDLVYLANSKGLISFVARYHSRFTCLDNIPVKKDTFVFEDTSVLTYMPIIANYDFSIGRSQGFNALICPEGPDPTSLWLPPMKRFVTFTSIRDEYLDIDSRKIKAENLILKMRNYPQGAIWVSKSDRSILKISLPAKRLTITRSFHPITIKGRDRSTETKGYHINDISFKNNGMDFAGSLSVPDGEGPFPAILLIPGDGAHDRHHGGFFTSLSDYLSRNGFSVLRYDKRRTGKTKTDSPATDTIEISDAASALHYLLSQTSTDPESVTLIGHDKGSYYVLALGAQNNSISGLVLMAPSFYPEGGKGERAKQIGKTAAKSKWSNEYLDLVMKAIKQTEETAAKTQGDWISIMGKRCYAKQVREEFETDPKDIIAKIKMPVLILQGKKDTCVIEDTAPILDRLLAEYKNEDHSLRYYGYLGHYFGTKTNDGVHRFYREVDKDVLETIKEWIRRVTSRPKEDKEDGSTDAVSTNMKPESVNEPTTEESK